MFDELKDPYPPQATEVHIVSVIARAHRIRHRQRMAVFATTATFAAGIGGVAWMARSTQSSTLTAGAPSETPIATLTVSVNLLIDALSGRAMRVAEN